MDKSILNSNAVQKPLTAKPSINLSASRTIQAFITNKNKPKVTTVIGMVSTIKIGLTTAFNTAKTKATIKAAV